MAKWLNTIDIKDVWQTSDTIQIAAAIASQLRGIIETESTDDLVDAEEIFDELCFFVDDDIPDVEAFDRILDQLYDWGNLEVAPGVKTCWVRTL